MVKWKFTGGKAMNNNDILIRLRYALDIKDVDMVKIFKLGGIELTIEEVKKILVKSTESTHDDDLPNDEEEDESIKCSNLMLESFLNGLIILKRGKKEPISGIPEEPILSIKDNGHVNNVMLKKLKIALSLTSEEMLQIFEEAGIVVTKGELSAVFRKEGQRNYKECGDRYARNFLKGLAIKYRK